MKKALFSLAVLACTAATAQAQATFGVKAGGSLTTFTGKGSDGAENMFGFHGGLVANLAVNDMFSVQPELLFSMKGAQQTEKSGGTSFTSKVKLNYLDIPVLAKVNAGSGLFFEAGPQLGILLSAKASVPLFGEVDLKSETKDIDFGYAVGLGYAMPEGGFMGGLRYNGGITDLGKNNTSTEEAIRNSGFQVYVGYMFGGK